MSIEDTLTNEQLEAAYRYQQRQYTIADAEAAIKAIIYATDDFDDLDEAELTEAENTFAEKMGFDFEYALSYADVVADRYLDNVDCNQAYNAQLASIDSDVFRCIENGKLYVPGEHFLYCYLGRTEDLCWGNEINPHDGSRISDPNQFKNWLDQCNANLYRLLKKGGRMAVLTGDSRYKGKYFSMFKEMNIFGNIEQVIIKTQQNCVSDNIKYSGKFIPIEHE